MSAEAKKEKYFGPERNARRREAYATDPDRAEKIRQQRRESYARRTGKSSEEVKTCLRNVNLVPSSGARIAVSLHGVGPIVIGRVFTQTDVAKLIDRQAQVIYRWHQREIFPSPVLQDDKGNTYYADEEVTDFIKILGEHQLTTPHYRVDHKEIRDRLFAASFSKNKDRANAWIAQRT